MDLTRGGTHDHVDTPYWSVFQIKAKQINADKATSIGEQDIGKVTLKLLIEMPGYPLCKLNMRAKDANRD